VKLEIDNFDDAGVCDYTAALDAEWRPKIVRKLNLPAEMSCALVALGALRVPASGARAAWRRDSGEALFTGYVTDASREHLGWNEAGPMYRYRLKITGDEYALDAALIAPHPTMVQKSAGEIVREITPADIDAHAVDDCGVVSQISPGLIKWSDCVALASSQARASYSLNNGKLTLRPIGAQAFTIRESDAVFSPERLQLWSSDRAVNEITVLGKSEADAYVKDYFLGDSYALRFDLSQTPFGQTSSTLLSQEYDRDLDPLWWRVEDPHATVSVNSGKLWVLGTGACVSFAEQVELKGALLFQHGDVTFTGASDGVIGGLFEGEVCVAGFRVTKSGSQSTIAPLIKGAMAGQPLTTEANHRYLLSTRVYVTETVRCGERYRSSVGEKGGAKRAADARVVFEVHVVDLNDQTSLVAPATVLYDGMVTGIAAFCEYRLADATDLHFALAYTRIVRLANVLVRSALPGQPYRTRLAGALMDGAECNVYMNTLQFYSANVPASDEKIVAEYRGYRKSVATANSPLKPTEGLNGTPGRSMAVEVVSPQARTSEDCANAALAILDDSVQQAWSGQYATWSDFLGAADLWPGDAVKVDVPSRACSADMIVREVEIDAVDPANDRSWYSIKFANEACESIAIHTTAATPAEILSATQLDPQVFILPGLPQAQVTDITSTSVTIDMGCDPVAGGGFEIRRSDSGWDPLVDRNLVGRFNTRVITVTRLSRVMSYWVRQYDGENRYSRSATLLHVDYPL
jgi:hypothetical protein